MYICIGLAGAAEHICVVGCRNISVSLDRYVVGCPCADLRAFATGDDHRTLQKSHDTSKVLSIRMCFDVFTETTFLRSKADRSYVLLRPVSERQHQRFEHAMRCGFLLERQCQRPDDKLGASASAVFGSFTGAIFVASRNSAMLCLCRNQDWRGTREAHIWRAFHNIFLDPTIQPFYSDVQSGSLTMCDLDVFAASCLYGKAMLNWVKARKKFDALLQATATTPGVGKTEWFQEELQSMKDHLAIFQQNFEEWHRHGSPWATGAGD